MTRALPSPRVAAGLGLLGLLLAYAAWIHHGLGPVRDPLQSAWYQPRNFLFEWASVDPLTGSVGNGLVGFGAVAVVLAVGVWLALRSALARLLAVWAVLFVLLCVYYGIEAEGIWRFFHWRGSAVMALLALAVAAAATSPWLAGAAERLPWPASAGLYMAVVLGVLAFMRNATGTDPSLRFALSPWPVVPVFGLELLVPASSFVIAVLALGRGLLGDLGPRVLTALSVAMAALAVGAVVAWVSSTSAGDWRLPVAALGLATLGLVAAPGRNRPGHRAALGALLTAAPVLAGMALVERDYTYTRDQRAQRITAALQAHYEREGGYPDEPGDLVALGLLGYVPVPRVGFRFLEEQEFVYQNFGISYLLEFSAPRWVQCAYNPPYQDEDLDEEEPQEELDDEGALPGSWSCPAKPPELW